ncbi:MAG: hypothetical protein N3D72_02895, partial [Candidatus Methanomethyliaceae archaeon]|nr:hypothetical protein [Candidatus Methanomethyliaceae archaeon]
LWCLWEEDHMEGIIGNHIKVGIFQILTFEYIIMALKNVIQSSHEYHEYNVTKDIKFSQY